MEIYYVREYTPTGRFLKIISLTGYFLARMQLHACRFRLAKKEHTKSVLQCSIFNFLTVFGIKITKSSRIPKWKVDISSNYNGIVH